MKYDVIIVGASAGGSAAAYHLTQTGRQVLLLDPQPLQRHAACSIADARSGLPGADDAPLTRLSRRDFHRGVRAGVRSWPIDYDELAPYYDEAERLLSVRPLAIEPDLQRIVDRVRRLDPRWVAQPIPQGHARDTRAIIEVMAGFDRRPSRRTPGADAGRSLLDRVRHMHGLHIVADATVAALTASHDDPRRVNGVRCENGRAYHADAVLLAAGTTGSPRLLQRYLEGTGLDRTLPCYGNVGRRLRFQALSRLLVVSPRVVNDVVRETAMLTSEAFPHSSVQSSGDIDGRMIGDAAPDWFSRRAARALERRGYGFFLRTEDGAGPDRRAPSTPGAPDRLDYDIGRVLLAADEHRRLSRTLSTQLLRLGYLPILRPVGMSGTSHAFGSLMAGNDPRSSVVDDRGRVHGLDNVYVVDGSVVPGAGALNPSLTIYAWALRVASLLPRDRQRQAA